ARLDLDGTATARGIYRIALDNMTLATRGLLAEKGYDPREFALLSYGGAGSLFTPLIARELGVREVIVPRLASVFSAFGAASADVRRDGARTVLVSLPGGAGLPERTLAELEAEGSGPPRA